MQIKDIVNRDVVNLTNCDQEPIHIPGSIQPHGFLVAVDNNLVIQFSSGNLQNWTGISHTIMLGKHVSELLGNGQLNVLEHYIKNITANLSSPLILEIGEKKFQCTIHLSHASWIIEFEPLEVNQPGISTIYDQTLQFVQYMREAETLQQLCQKVATEIKKLTGYDRVMVYRFDKDYNGEVYAESKNENLESFFGLHYPHTDIPVQARELYLKNLLRIIVDINYTPVPIYTIDDGSNKNLDLSLSVLRSTSPIHVQYLQNMGVGATLTISLVHQDKLWGLIACHHYSYKYIDHYTRINAQLQGHFLTSQINIRQAAEEYSIAREVNNALEKMLNRSFAPERSSLPEIVADESMPAICNAAGVAILHAGIVYRSGLVPGDESILNLAAWAAQFTRNRSLYTSKLKELYQEAASICDTASGIIYHSLQSFDNACVIWFNPETNEEVNWAGDPEKAIEKNENGLSPRKSFESWKQITKCQAREWKEPELNAAANYASALQKHVSFILLNEEEKSQRLLSEQLKTSNSELENINWISTHDLKEPLRKIQVFSSKLLNGEEEFSEHSRKTLTKVNNAAARMQKLIDGLTMYSKTRSNEAIYTSVNLDEMLNNVITGIHEEIIEKKAEIHVGKLPVVEGIPVLLQQLFVNLINNALKFSRTDVPPVISISAAEEPVLYHEPVESILCRQVTVTDNGIGFDPSMSEQIFKIFSRLNPVAKYEGSGIGLALCKKIMQLHHGFIEASSTQGNGASFTLYFPVEVKDSISKSPV